MPVNRYYSSAAQETTLTGSISNSATSMTVGGVTGWPSQYPYTIIVDRGTASEEVITVTNAVSTSLTVTRGVDGTSAQPHTTGANVVHGVSARDLREPQDHISFASGVHGVAGVVVGTTDTQTLSNKTLSAPVVNNGSWASANLTGTPTITDLTNIPHDHATAAKGGAVTQAAVTGLPTRLTNIESVNTTQDSNISSLGTRMTTAEGNITTTSSNLTTTNANVTANTNSIATLQNPPHARLKRTADQTIPDSTVTPMLWNAEDADTHNAHDNVTNPSRYTAPTTGVYLVSCSIPWFTNATGIRELNFKVNNATTFAGQRMLAGGGVTVVLTATHMIALTAGDYVEAAVWQSSGAGLVVDNSYASGPRMEIVFLR